DQGDASDVNLLNDICFRSSRSYSFLERIQIYDHQVDRRNVIFYCLVKVSLVISSLENPAEDFWVQSLDSSTENGRIAGQIFHRNDFSSLLFDKLLSTTGGVDFYSVLF